MASVGHPVQTGHAALVLNLQVNPMLQGGCCCVGIAARGGQVQGTLAVSDSPYTYFS